MTTDEWTDRLSAYVDGELDSTERAALEIHLRECADCRAVLEELGELTQWAASYPGRDPERDVWPSIRAAISERVPDRLAVTGATLTGRGAGDRVLARVPMALATGIALLAVGAGSWWLARATAPPTVSEVVVGQEPATGSAPEVAILAAERYGGAIAQLQRALLEGESVLDSSTVRVLREKLSIIDRAIGEAREALSEDPNSNYLADHFASLMRRKLSLLRNAAAVVES